MQVTPHEHRQDRTLLAPISQAEIAALTDRELIQRCIQPIILRIRARSMSIKAQVLAQATHGQAAVVLFCVLVDHAGSSSAELSAWIATLCADPNTWRAVLSSTRFFQAGALEQVLAELETAFSPGIEASRAAQPAENTPERFPNPVELNRRFHETVQATQALIGAYIRRHPEEFVSNEMEPGIAS